MAFGLPDEFTPAQERRLAQLMDARLKGTRHANADHLERALLVSKLKPGGVAGSVLTDTGRDAEWVAMPRAWTIDSRASTGSGTTTTAKVISGAGASQDFNGANGATGMVAVDPAAYDIPTGFKLQIRGVWSYATTASTTGRNWTFGLYDVASIAGGAITTGTTYATVTVGATLIANTFGTRATAWADLATAKQLFATHSPLAGSASAAMFVANRIEARIVPA